MTSWAHRGGWFASMIGVLTCLTGCAAPSDPAHMTIGQSAVSNTFPEALRHAMCARNVTGGEETNPMWASKVSSPDFLKALAASMEAVGLNAPSGACKYYVDANLLGLSQPTFGFSMEVTSHVNYKVYDAAGQPMLLETISAAYTEPAGFNSGVQRLQLADEGSIRASLLQFMEKLREVKLP